MSLFAELKRRNVIRMAGLYLVGAWLVVQVASTLLPVFEAPAWVMKVLVGLLAVGIVPVLAFSWLYELTPEGLKRDVDVPPEQSIAPRTAQRMNRLLVAGLVLALGYFAVDKFVLAPARGIRVSELPSDTPASEVPAASSSERGPDPLIPTDSSIAVLPFVNMSSDKEQEYFSDGLSEELLNQLAQIPTLRVIARTSSFSFKGKEVDVATIARALNVAHVLEGSVRKSGNTLRITAQLIRAADSSHLWSQTYDREMADVFKVQDEISREVVAALKLQLLPGQMPGNTQRTRDPAAYEQYLLGIQLISVSRGQQPLVEASAAALERAIAIAPDYANAYAELAFAQFFLADFARDPALREAMLQRSIASGDKAIALAPDLPDGYAGRGNTRYRMRWDWQGARADFERALKLDANNSRVLTHYGPLLFAMGRRPEGIAVMRKATEADPLSAEAWTALGRHLTADHQLIEAHQALKRGFELNPEFVWVNFLLGNLELAQGRAELAMGHYARAPEQFRLTGTAMVEYTRGNEAASKQALATLEARFAVGFSFQIAQAHAWRGEKDQAFAWLDRAYELHDAGIARLPYDPGLDPLRDDPRFAALVQKVGFPK